MRLLHYYDHYVSALAISNGVPLILYVVLSTYLINFLLPCGCGHGWNLIFLSSHVMLIRSMKCTEMNIGFVYLLINVDGGLETNCIQMQERMGWEQTEKKIQLYSIVSYI